MRRLVKRIAFVAALLTAAGYFAWRYWDLTDRRAQSRRAREAAEALEARLDRVVSLDVQDIPLRKLLSRLAREHGVTIDVDATALANVGIKRDPAVTIAVRDVTLREALRRIVNSFDEPLVAVPRSGRVLVTTPLEAVDDVVLEVYPLPPHISGATGVTEEQFRDVVTRLYAPETYDLSTQRSYYRNILARPSGAMTYAGAAAVEAFPGGVAVVQTPEVHREIKELLAALEEVELSPDRIEPFDLDPPSAEERRIEQVLAQPAEIVAVNGRLDQAASAISALSGLPVRVDRQLIANRELGRWGEPITLRDVSLRTILRQFARCAEVTIDVHDDAAWFTTDETVEKDHRLLRVYPCGDLLTPRGGYQGTQLKEVIESTISPTSWIAVGGTCSIHACGHGLVILADESVQQDSAALLGDLRRHAAGVDPATPTPATRANLEAKLARRVSVDFQESSLEEVRAYLSHEFGLPIAFDREGLDAAGVTQEVPVTFQATNRPLGAVLNDLLAAHELTWMIADEELILFTTSEEVESDLRTIVYDVRHLVSPDFGPPDYDSLIETITSTIQPTSWTDVGGTGAITEGDGCLVVSQTDFEHRKIRFLLDALTRLFDERERFEPNELPSLAPEQDREIQAKLDRVASLEIKEETIQEFASRLHDELELPIQLDMISINESTAGDDVVSDYRKSFSIANVPLRTAIKQALMIYECNYVVRDGTLTITTDEWIDSAHVTRVYNVVDLVYAPHGQHDFDSLLELVTSVVAPDTWTDVGGNGAIQEFFTPYCDALVMSQTPEVFAEIDVLLANVRHLRDPARFPAPPRSPGEERIDKILDAPADLVFKETPLSDVAAALSDQWGVPVIADAPGGEDPYRNTCEIRGLPAREALVQALDPEGLDLAVDGEVILIVEAEDAVARFGDVRVYPWNPQTDNSNLAPHLDALLELLTQLVEPNGWYDAHGEGVVQELELGNVVAVRQRLAVQPDVAKFFEFLTSAKELDLPVAPLDAPLTDAHRDWVVEHLRGRSDDWLTRYAVHVAGESKAHDERFVPGLIELLQRLDPVREAALHELTAIALANHGRNASSAADVLSRQMEAPMGSQRRRHYFDLLAAIGPGAASHLTNRLINHPDQRALAVVALMSYGDEARDQAAVIVQAWVDGKFGWSWRSGDGGQRPQPTLGPDLPGITEILQAIDPDFSETRRAIDYHLASDDANIRERATMLSQAIDDATMIEPEEEAAPR